LLTITLKVLELHSARTLLREHRDRMSVINQHKVSFAKRLLIIIYESVLLFAIYMLAGIPATIMFQVTPEQTIKFIIYWLYILAVFFLYFGYCWTRSGQTLAMKAWRCKVSNVDGSNINWSQAFIRYLLAMVSWIVFGLGFLVSLFRKDRSTFHDLLSKSYLYKLEKKD